MSQNKVRVSPMRHYMTEGDALKLVRTRAGETQAEMGLKLGVTPQYVGRLERGEREMGNELRRLVRSLYGYDPYVLMSLTDASLDWEKHRSLADDS